MDQITVTVGSKVKKARRIYELAAIYLFIAHVGWIFEKLGRLIVYKSLADRGFLSLPLCPIYATAAVGAYLLFGTPSHMRILGKRIRGGRIKGVLLYFAASFILASSIELCIGAFFGEIVGLPLWNYSERAFNLFGYVCLAYSFLWGALMTLFMLTMWLRLELAVRRIGSKTLFRFCLCSYILIAADLAFNVIYMAMSGSHFEFL